VAVRRSALCYPCSLAESPPEPAVAARKQPTVADLATGSIGARDKPCISTQFSRIKKTVDIIYLKGYHCRQDLAEPRDRTQCGCSAIIVKGFINPPVAVSNMML
jgi:hypothetical protein